jgi:galactokinase
MAESRDLSVLENVPERDAYVHVLSEGRRVLDAVAALRAEDVTAFGRLLNESHASLRDRLRVSVGAVDQLVDCAKAAGAFGARMTGAGFGGCVLCLCTEQNVAEVEAALIQGFYVGRPEFDRAKHLFIAEASAGASL